MSSELFLDGRVRLECGDCRDVLASLPDNSIDSVVTDPPYALVSIAKRFGKPGSAPVKVGNINESNNLKAAYARAAAGFMGKQWDTGETAFAIEFWAEVRRVLKPGGHVVAFSGTRTYHRMACAIEDAGFEIRDQIGWAYGSGFPKSHDVAKQIDKMAGHWRGRAGAVKIVEQPAKGTEYERTEKGEPITAAAAAAGWGTALKPAWEPIVLARKPIVGTVAESWLEHGTGAINVDACRVATDEQSSRDGGRRPTTHEGYQRPNATMFQDKTDWSLSAQGRWPANVVHDGSEEVLAAFSDAPGQQFYVGPEHGDRISKGIYGDFGAPPPNPPRADSGTAARFFYSAKADANDRIGSKHPTVKPVDLMQWLARLVTPKGGLVLDPFAGTGTTGEAAFREGMSAILIEREAEYQADIRRRMALVLAGPEERTRESIKARGLTADAGPLFGGNAETTRGGADRFTESLPTSADEERSDHRSGRTQKIRGDAA